MNIINTIDNQIYEIIIKMLSPGVTAIMTFISFLGSAITLITLSIGFIFLIKNKKYPKLIALNLIFVFILNIILKWIIARPRPERLKLVFEDGYSFPSGHSMVAFGFYGFLIYLIYKNIKNKKIKYTLITFLSLLVLFIGISRVYLGVHYVTDVIGGFIFAFLYLVVFIKYFCKRIGFNK